MATDLNKVILIGRLTKDPELRYTQGGIPVASVSIASNRTGKVNGEKTEIVSFFNCIAWNKLGEIINEYSKKGDRIGIEGRLQQKSWEDQNGNKRSAVEIVIENFQFLSPKKNADGSERQVDSYSENNPHSDPDEIPF